MRLARFTDPALRRRLGAHPKRLVPIDALEGAKTAADAALDRCSLADALLARPGTLRRLRGDDGCGALSAA